MAYFIDGVEYTKEEYEEKLIEVKSHVSLIDDYVAKVQSEELPLEDLPEEYYQEVYDIINAPEPEPELPSNPYGVTEEQYNAIIDDYTLSLIESGVL